MPLRPSRIQKYRETTDAAGALRLPVSHLPAAYLVKSRWNATPAIDRNRRNVLEWRNWPTRKT